MDRTIVMGPKIWAMLVALSVLFGGSFFLTELALGGYSPLSIVAGRLAGAAGILFIVCRALGWSLPRDWASWGAFAIMGLLNNAVPFVLIVVGQTEISGAMASILISTTPIFTVVLAHVLTDDERLSWPKAVGTGIGLGGVIVLVGPELNGSPDIGIVGQAAVLGAALCYALAGIFGKRFHTQKPLVTATGMLICSTALMVPIALGVEMPWRNPWAPEAAGAVLALAVLSTAVAYLLYFRILAGAGATNLMLVTMLVPLTGSGLGVVVLGEAISLEMAVGGGLIVAGLVAIDGRLAKGWIGAGPKS